jgi:hypothetical protein
VKTYALWREGGRLVSHREPWEYEDRVAEELGAWVCSVFQHATSLHTCFYEGWCTRNGVEDVYTEVKKPAEALKKEVQESQGV